MVKITFNIETNFAVDKIKENFPKVLLLDAEDDKTESGWIEIKVENLEVINES